MNWELLLIKGQSGSVTLLFILEINFYFYTDSGLRGSDNLPGGLDLVARFWEFEFNRNFLTDLQVLPGADKNSGRTDILNGGFKITLTGQAANRDGLVFVKI